MAFVEPADAPLPSPIVTAWKLVSSARARVRKRICASPLASVVNACSPPAGSTSSCKNRDRQIVYARVDDRPQVQHRRRAQPRPAPARPSRSRRRSAAPNPGRPPDLARSVSQTTLAPLPDSEAIRSSAGSRTSSGFAISNHTTSASRHVSEMGLKLEYLRLSAFSSDVQGRGTAAR